MLLNRIEDRVNSHPDPVGGDITYNLELALALKDNNEGLRAYAISRPRKQGAFIHSDLRDA